MSFELIETICNDYEDVAEVFRCTDCRRTVYLQGVGGDIACCICEFEKEFPESD